MTLFFLDLECRWQSLEVTRETPSRLYFVIDGRQRFVSRTELDQHGVAMSRAVTGGLVYREIPSEATEPALVALGLDAMATPADVRRAYRTLAKVAHPDAGGSHQRFLELHAAYVAAMQALGG